MEVQIRAGRPRDHAAVLGLDIRAFDPRASPGPAPTPATDFFDRVAPEDHLLAVTVDPDGRELIVGYSRLDHPTSLPASRHVIAINGVAVDPGHRRRGIAGQLLEASVAEACRRGAKKVSLRVLGGNDAGKALYAKHGFEVEGHLVNEFMIDGVLVDDYILARHL